MDNKQDIGAAFKQRLADLNEGPADSAALWDQIATQLDAEGTSPKGLPFWLKSGLAVLIVGLTALGIWKFTSATSTNPNTDTELTESQGAPSDTETDPSGIDPQSGSNSTPIAAENEQTDATTNSDANLQSSTSDGVGTTGDSSDAVSRETPTTSETNSTTLSSSTPNSNETTTSVTTVASSSPVTTTQTNTVPAINKETNTATANTSTAVSTSSVAATGTGNSTSTGTVASTGVQPNTSTGTNSSENGLGSTAVNSNTSTNTGDASSIAAATTKQNTTVDQNTTSGQRGQYPARGYYVLPKNTVNAAGIVASSFDADVEITASGAATPLPLVKYEEKKIKKTKEFRAFERMLRREELTNYRWSVGAVIAPTTYGSLTRASMLDARLEGNTREGETNLSYGLQIKNQVNEKTALRFGLNRVNLGYNTQNFQVNIIDNVVNIYQLTGIDAGAEISDGGIPLDPSATAFFESNDVVTIDQDISYLEIPVEYQYSFINNRFGANLIGGASLMVLDDNRIFAVNDNGQSVRVGKSSNLTNLGYTLNLGLGFKYEITKHFQLNLDPMFKIQMNKPENTTVNNFRPFFFGVFSGLHFKF
ncbi:hypothetical protein [Gilvibacter sediminis]|uniref:hypothetical protein n=1 Tax=Gilvibacter sediminis TaxID=379071 RepID=UPI00234FD7C3|nr:hypothetical protein [Gilvibacter sediminis]MDC7998626.1 hypothetical protein [Gilvibacter sediminis]